MFVVLDAGAEITIAIAKFLGMVIGTAALALIKPFLDKRKSEKILKSVPPSTQLPPNGGPVTDDPPTARRQLSPAELDVLREDRLRAEVERLREQVSRLHEEKLALRDSLADCRARYADVEAKMLTQEQIKADIERMTSAIGAAHAAADERIAEMRKQEVEPLKALVEELRTRLNELVDGEGTPIQVLPTALPATVPPPLPAPPKRIVEAYAPGARPTPAGGSRKPRI